MEGIHQVSDLNACLTATFSLRIPFQSLIFNIRTAPRALLIGTMRTEQPL